MKSIILRYDNSDFKKLERTKKKIAEETNLKVNWEEFILAINEHWELTKHV